MRNIPVLFAKGKSLAEAYENALIELYKNGGRIKTQYDKEGDPLSIDSTMNITIEEPLTDPMIHKAFPGSIYDLREYVMELEGAKDNWVKNIDDPNDTRWTYTYHGRFAHCGSYKKKTLDKNEKINDDFSCLGKDGYAVGDNINQFDYVVDKLSKQPFTRQAQMITWITPLDIYDYDCPCLQSWWGRIMEEDDVWYLNYNMRIRSNDCWGACMMNMFGLTMMTKELIADKIAEKTGRKVLLGRMNWHADSWHIYGKDIQQAKERLFDRISKTSFQDRIYNFYDPDIQEMYNECEPDILKKIENKNIEYKNV